MPTKHDPKSNVDKDDRPAKEGDDRQFIPPGATTGSPYVEDEDVDAEDVELISDEDLDEEDLIEAEEGDEEDVGPDSSRR